MLKSPFFTPLHPVLAELESESFPALGDCNALLAARTPTITVQSGKPLRFMPQECGKLPFEAQYEPRCYLKGEVQTRANNWHDLFNALVWLTFPKTKAVLNARHYDALTVEGAASGSHRGAVRDVNTLFDESGVIVVYADANSDIDLAGLLHNFEWKELFWHRREQVMTGMGFYLFGHGLCEKALQPYVGMTGQGLLIRVEQGFFSLPPAQQLTRLDSLLAAYLAKRDHFRSTRDVSPVPLLGVPGWAADNDCAAYYDNAAYFRPGRRGAKTLQERARP